MNVALLYISRSALPSPAPAETVADILTVSRSRNAALDLSGVLIWTGAGFAQIIEGPAAAVEQVMTSICRDPRHRDIKILFTRPAKRRRFGGGPMGYYGPAAYVDRHLATLFDGLAAHALAIEQLATLMEEFARMAERRR